MYRGISDFKKVYHPRTDIIKYEKGDLVTGSHSILNRCRNYFSQLLNVHGVNDVRQTDIHTAEPLAPQPSHFEVQMAVQKLKRHKSPGTYRIPEELIKARGRTIYSGIHTLINSTWSKEELPEERKESIIVPIYMGDKTDCSNYRSITLLSTT